MLDVVGLTPEAEIAYEALLVGGQATTEQLAGTTVLSLQRLRTVLRTLEDRGLVSSTSRPPGRYSAVDPGIALDVLLLEREEQIKRARIRVLELSERFHEAVAGRDPTQLVEIVTDVINCDKIRSVFTGVSGVTRSSSIRRGNRGG